jgi:hypothetical protein
MSWVGFEAKIPVFERPKTVHALDSAAIVIDNGHFNAREITSISIVQEARRRAELMWMFSLAQIFCCDFVASLPHIRPWRWTQSIPPRDLWTSTGVHGTISQNTLRFSSRLLCIRGPPLWSSGQRSWLQIQRSRVWFPALADLRSSGSGTGSTPPREYNWGATWMEK